MKPLWLRLIERRAINPLTGCWVWSLYTDPEGYAYFSVAERKFRAHRLAYETFIGPIPDGMVTDHLCENTSCINPWHLEPVTNEENMRRRSLRMTTCRKGHPRTPEDTYVDRGGKKRCKVCARNARKLRRAAA